MQQKQNRGNRSQSRSTKTVVSPALLRIFRKEGAEILSEKIVFNGQKFVPTVEDASQPTPSASALRKSIHRIVFFDSDGKDAEIPLLVIDVHPTSTLKLNDSQKDLKLEFSLATPFAAIGKQLRFEAEIAVERVGASDRPVFKSFTVFNRPTATPPTINLMQAIGPRNTDRLKLLLTLADDRIPALLHKSSTGFEPSFLKAITGISIERFNCDSSAPHKTEFRFISLPNARNEWPKTLQLRLQSRDISKCPGSGERRIRTFWDRETFEYTDKNAPDQWSFVQRPAKELSIHRPIVRGASPRARWILSVFGLPTVPVIRSWNKLVSDFQLAIHRSRGGHGVSFLPTFFESSGTGGDGKEKIGRWSMAYEIVDANSESADAVFESSNAEPPVDKIGIRPLSLRLTNLMGGSPPVLQGVFEQIRNINNQDLATVHLELKSVTPIEFDAQLEVPEKLGVNIETPKAVIIRPRDGTRAVVRMGSLDLDFAATVQAVPGTGNLRLRPIGKNFEQVIDVEASYDLAIKGVSPGGQDYAVSEEYDNTVREDSLRPCIRPKPPIVIPLPDLLPGPATPPTLLLRVQEKLSDHHRIILEIISQTAGDKRDPGLSVCQEADRAVLVLDRNPFLVAEVRYLSFDRVTPFGTSIIAVWDSDDGIGGAWQLQLEERPFCLVLPPQAVGEEMIKNQPLPIKAVPFNLGSATTMELNARRARTDFAETPWNLRRILATQAQTQQGPVVKSIHYELLYGLSADANNPGIRLADVFSQAGRPMPIPARIMAWPATAAQEKAYEEYRRDWGKLYSQLLSRIAVMVPWDELLPSSDRKPVVLSRSVSSRLRLPPHSNLARPVDLLPTDPTANLPNGSLRGGATWGFESKNIYTAVVKNPSASSSRLENFAFSSLGGWGKQEAGFQGDLTKISADVAMGRAFHYQVERLGRISCTWNLAKHVIVYERTVVPSRQFVDPDPTKPLPLAGWPILRKVREYIQILEPKRSFPDNDQLPEERRGADAKQSRGFVDSCEFPEGAEFNVNGAWGSDVGDYGWKIPIWQVGAMPEDIYPKPKVQFGFDSNLGDQQKVNRCDCDNPENFYFFTLTRDLKDPTKDPDRDPRKWEPIVDVDFVNKPRPKAFDGDFKDGDPRALSPADPPVPVHYGPCTFRVVPSAIPVDLVSGRAGKAMAAVVNTITLARSANPTNVASWPSSIKAVEDLQKDLSSLSQEILKRLPLDANPTSQITAEIKTRLDEHVVGYTDKLRLAKDAVNGLKAELVRDIQKAELLTGSIFERLKERVRKLVDSVILDLEQQVREFPVATPFDVDGAKALLLEIQHTIEEILLIKISLPGVTPQFLARYVDLVMGLRSTLDFELERIKRLSIAGAPVRETAAEAAALLQRAQGMVKAFQTVGLNPPLPLIPDPISKVRGNLAPYFNGLESAGNTLLDNLRKAADPAAARKIIDDFKRATYYTTLQDLTNLKTFIKTAFGADIDIAKPAADIVKQIDKAVHVAQQWQADALSEWRREVKAAADRIRTSKAELEAARDALKTFLTTRLNTLVNNLKTALDVSIQKAAEFISNSLETVVADLEIPKVHGELKRILEGELANVKAELETHRDKIADFAGQYLEQAARLLKDSPEFQTADKTLRLIRAFGEPPRVPKLDFDRTKMGYFYDELVKQVNLTPAVALLSQAENVAEKLKPLGVRLPTKQTLDQFLPVNLKEFDVSRIFPSFAGINFTHLLNGKKLPDIGSENVQITQGLDAQTRRAYVRADVKFGLPGASTLFAIGPLLLQIVDADFRATSEISTDITGKVTKKMSGQITADWLLTISNIAIIKFRQTELRFDDSNGVRFSFNPKNIELPEIMAFLSSLMSVTGEDGTGLTIGLLPDGVQTILSLPLPDVQAGVSGISNLHLLAMMALRFSPFSISVGLGLARKEAPFSLTLFILGGGGFVEAWVTYTPESRKLSCSVEVGITVSASIAIALGPIKGGVYAYFGITALFQSGRGLSFGVLYVLRGQVSVLGIVSACVTLMLEARYTPSTKQLQGRGRVSIKIKICWCFTLKVEQEVTYTLGSGGRARALPQRNGRPESHAHHPLLQTDPYPAAIRDYLSMLE